MRFDLPTRKPLILLVVLVSSFVSECDYGPTGGFGAGAVTFTEPAWTVTVCESSPVGTGTGGSGTGTVTLTGGTPVCPETSTEAVTSLCEVSAGCEGGDGSVSVLLVGAG